MNIVKIHDADLREAAAKGLDDFVDVFYKAALDSVGGSVDGESMQKLNQYQMTLVVFKTLHDEVMDGGFVQLIYNGYGPFVFSIHLPRQSGNGDLTISHLWLIRLANCSVNTVVRLNENARMKSLWPCLRNILILTILTTNLLRTRNIGWKKLPAI